ncbi:beta-1 adrenergic receptor-like isoform X1 [Physella acuta]|uniref:beta-1 adrenergic receptor-like isoform X1 n=1 Tax=Physella acuta TaxID=109671 RepID=UPI0027DBF355|nr:beta-1 adrenergic receptor-like isoform X1 [Physella acuta]XP_059166704.1 beta-1 adrenergic receptor-like isoform X1 [Physella acuta]XP_059166705.1 beta-1 adrenergic receptor-like isoform X1 [Physella acuta]XP_059166706.1 beta-1 adrenergic receptor-like isoform X1 [Physella acuta]
MDELGVTSTTSSPHEPKARFRPEELLVIAFTLWVIFSNLVIILAILRSEYRRKISFNLHVCNLCVAGLVMGVLVMPLLTEYRLRNQWIHDEQLCRIWLIADMAVCTVSILAIVAIIFDRFVLFSCPYFAEGACKYVMTSVLIMLTWAGGLGIIVPIYIYGETGTGVNSAEGYCFLHLNKPFSLIIELAGYAVPAVISVGLLIATTITFFQKRDELRDLEFSDEREHKGWQVLMLWVICFSVLVMWFPFVLIHVLFFFLTSTSTLLDWLTFAMWLSYANSGINPLLWMITPKLRQSVKALFCCCRKHQRYEDNDFVFDEEANSAMVEFQEKI